MKYVFVNGRVAIVIRYWEQRGDVVEGGARIDIRSVTQVEGSRHRPGAAGLTIGPVDGGGIWRADLFVILSEGGQQCFHYHPKFKDGDVGARFDDTDLAEDPRKWIEESLRDLPKILTSSGADALMSSVDMDAHRRAVPLMMSSVDACLAEVPVRFAAMPNRLDE